MHVSVNIDALKIHMQLLETELCVLEHQKYLWTALQSQPQIDPQYSLFFCRQIQMTEKHIQCIRNRYALLEEIKQRISVVIHSTEASLDEMIDRLYQIPDGLTI